MAINTTATNTMAFTEIVIRIEDETEFAHEIECGDTCEGCIAETVAKCKAAARRNIMRREIAPLRAETSKALTNSRMDDHESLSYYLALADELINFYAAEVSKGFPGLALFALTKLPIMECMERFEGKDFGLAKVFSWSIYWQKSADLDNLFDDLRPSPHDFLSESDYLEAANY